MPRTRRGSLRRVAKTCVAISRSSSNDMDTDVDFNYQIEKKMQLQTKATRQTKRARTGKNKQASTSVRKVSSIAKNTNTSIIDLDDSDDEPKSINVCATIQGKVDNFFKSSGLISDDEDALDILVNTRKNAINEDINSCEIHKPSGSVAKDMNEDVIMIEDNANGINSLEDIENYCKETENLLKNANALLEKFAGTTNDDNPQLEKPESNEGENSKQEKGLGECPICYDKLSEKQVMSTKCGHLFCKDCMDKIVNTAKKCPTCRKAVNKKNIISIYI